MHDRSLRFGSLTLAIVISINMQNWELPDHYVTVFLARKMVLISLSVTTEVSFESSFVCDIWKV